MNCDQVRELLPDFVLDALSEVETAAVRRHLRGCAACRADAAKLDDGLTLFAGVAHTAEPPPELQDRVMEVLKTEWEEAPASSAPRRRRFSARMVLAVAASAVLLAGALAWGVTNQIRANHDHADAVALHDFLGTLGGKDVREGKLEPGPAGNVQGSFVIYDGWPGEGRSWVLVLVRAPGYTGNANATLVSSTERPIKLFPIQVSNDGEGWTAMFADANLSAYNRLRITSPGGQLLASGQTINHG